MFSSITNIKSNSLSSDFKLNFSSIYNLNNNGNELSSNQNLLGIPIHSLPLIAKEYVLNNEADIIIKNKDIPGLFDCDTINTSLLKEEPTNNMKSNNFSFTSRKLLTENNFDYNFLIKKRRKNSFNFLRNNYKFPNILNEELKRNDDDIYNIVKSFNNYDSINIFKKEYINDNLSNNFNFLKIKFKSNIYSVEFEREISLNLYFKELKENLTELIIENYKLYNNFDLMYQNKFVNDNDKVLCISQRENVIIDIIFHIFKKEENKLIIENKISRKNKKQTIENIQIKREKVNKKELPILEKEGYLTIPTIPDLYNMSNEEIENVNNFTIFNNYGTILFPGKTNLKNLNLDEIIDISDRNITVYKFPENKHKIGFGLNKEAIITLNNINFNENKEFYLKKIKLIGGRFMEFNEESFQLTFYKNNFEE